MAAVPLTLAPSPKIRNVAARTRFQELHIDVYVLEVFFGYSRNLTQDVRAGDGLTSERFPFSPSSLLLPLPLLLLACLAGSCSSTPCYVILSFGLPMFSSATRGPAHRGRSADRSLSPSPLPSRYTRFFFREATPPVVLRQSNLWARARPAACPASHRARFLPAHGNAC